MASPPYASSPLAMSPPNPSPAQLPNKKRSSTLDVNAPPVKRRKPSNLSQSGPVHPLRQTSFPPEGGRSPYARSPSVDATSIVSGSAASGVTASGAPKKKRGRKAKNPRPGDESAEQTPSLVGGKAPTTVSGQGGGDKDAGADDDDDDENQEMALEEGVARTQEQKQEEIRLRAMLVEAFDSEQYNRYELWRAAKLSDAVVKRVGLTAAVIHSPHGTDSFYSRWSTRRYHSRYRKWSAQPSRPWPSCSPEKSSNRLATCRPSGSRRAKSRATSRRRPRRPRTPPARRSQI